VTGMNDIIASNSPTDLAFEQGQTQKAAAGINTWSRGKWARRITESWQMQVPSIFEVAALLKSAKEELRRGDWMKMVKAELPFSQSTANKLLKIGQCEHLRNSEHVPNLPAHWGTLFELTLMTPEQFEHSFTSGAITPRMQRKDVRVLRGATVATTGAGTSAFALLKERAAEQACEIATLKAQLSNVQDGSVFDLRRDTPKSIAAVIAATVTEAKATTIAEAIKAAIKAKKKAA
jgi:hypothetical protein